MNTKKMEVANFTCRSSIGDVELLDVFGEYVYEAMKNQEVPGSGRSEIRSYKFIDLKFQKINGEIILYGRLVKNLNLAREQILKGEILIESYETMESAPSSFFVLILSNHKLLWVREKSRAPLLKDFKYVMEKMLERQREELVKEYILKNQQILLLNNDKESLNRKAYSEYPELDISVTQIGNKIEIKEKLAKFENIYKIKLVALKRNNEMGTDLCALSRLMSQTQEGTGAKNVTTNINGDSKHPLNKEYATQLIEASADGNYEFKIKGCDSEKNIIEESNETVSLKTDINYVEKEDKLNSATMLGKFMTLTPKYHTLPRQKDDLHEKLRNIERKFL